LLEFASLNENGQRPVPMHERVDTPAPFRESRRAGTFANDDTPFVDPNRVEKLVSEIDQSEGPPPGIKATGLQMLLDEDQRTAVVLQFFDSAQDMRDSEAAFDAMDSSETPGTRVSIDRGEVKLELRM
jgi:hypothetical protein